MRVTHLGLCIRVIVNENPLNLENTTSSILSVLLINLWLYIWENTYCSLSRLLRQYNHSFRHRLGTHPHIFHLHNGTVQHDNPENLNQGQND